VEFRDVSFTYPPSSGAAPPDTRRRPSWFPSETTKRRPRGPREVLTGVSFTIPAGKTVALVGANGAGKTTLVKLLSRLYDPTAGAILLDGTDLRELDLEDLRGQVAVVFQDYARLYELQARRYR
jgi:ATP-binding cassette subfamily B protein